jgi:hypothetical protein
MTWRWLVRVALIVGAFLLGTWASFFLLMLLTWDQALLDVLTTSVGLAASGFTLFKTRWLTRPKGGTNLGAVSSESG